MPDIAAGSDLGKRLSGWTLASECGPDEVPAACTNSKGQTALGCRQKAYLYEPGTSCKGMRFVFDVKAPMPTTVGPPTPIRPTTPVADTHPLGPTGPAIETNRPQGSVIPTQTVRSTMPTGLRSSAFGFDIGVPTVGSAPGRIYGLTNGTTPSIPGGSTPTTPGGGIFQPVIDQGCSQLPSWAQGACQAAGNWLTNTGSPGGQTQQVPSDPTPIGVTPGQASTGQMGISSPMLVQRNRLECLPAPNGGRQVLYYSPMTGEQVCLPAKGGAAFAKSMGLLRKWSPRPKPYISAQDVKVLKKADRMTKKAKAFAKLTGQTCKPRGRGR